MVTRLGIDIGGTGIKGAPVDLGAGELSEARHRLLTPKPATPEAVADVVAQVVAHFGRPTEAIGATFPGVVQHGVVHSAANVEKSWIGVDAAALLGEAIGAPVTVVNDADAAGLAEVTFGAGRDRHGNVLMLTLGTGIGSALFTDGRLVSNTELGHLRIRGKDAEHRASEIARERDGLSWKQWAKRLNEYLEALEAALTLDLIIIGGGVSKKHDKFVPLLDSRAEIVPAELFNDAGIVGAALAADTI